ncbi:MAG: phosphatase PAP2 family protein [Acidimicrobiales bacterium]
MIAKLRRLAGRRWLRELAYVLFFYIIYSMIRNRFGSASVEPDAALDNALRVIDFEASLGLFFEQRLQEVFLDYDWFLRAWNIFYGSFHFAVTGGIMIWLYVNAPSRYRKYRTVLATTTALALIGFATFPLMPPRLLSEGPPFGGGHFEFDFVDTLAEVGGLWSFSSGGMAEISNQYAAMPSLHIAWALWCVLAIFPLLTRTWQRVLLVSYPVMTLFAVVVTANHYWIDAVGGAVILGVGYYIAQLILRVMPVPSDFVEAS